MNRNTWRWGVAGSFATLAIAISPALDARADASFSWHMVQHLLILLVAPLLLLLAQPFGIFAALAGKRRTASFVLATRRLHVLAFPPLALAIYVGAIWLTHFSGLYEAALTTPIVHVLEHGLYFFAGTCFWLPVVAPAPLRPLAFPIRLFYLLVAIPQGPFLSIALDAARTPLYAHYLQFSTKAQAVADQQTAAAIMWIGGGAVLFAAFLITLGAWAKREGRASITAVACYSDST